MPLSKGRWSTMTFTVIKGEVFSKVLHTNKYINPTTVMVEIIWLRLLSLSQSKGEKRRARHLSSSGEVFFLTLQPPKGGRGQAIKGPLEHSRHCWSETGVLEGKTSPDHIERLWYSHFHTQRAGWWQMNIRLVDSSGSHEKTFLIRGDLKAFHWRQLKKTKKHVLLELCAPSSGASHFAAMKCA